MARAAAWVRLRAFSLRKMLFTWVLTVLVETKSLPAISALESPAATSASTSRMSRAGDMLENPVTGERVVVRAGTEESGGDLLVADLYVRPGGAVAGEHVHTRIEEWFTVMNGRIGFRLDGHEIIAPYNERLHVPAGVAHDWWNPGKEARVVVEVAPGPGSRR